MGTECAEQKEEKRKTYAVVMIGAGNLATRLARELYRKGIRIVQVYSRTEQSARMLARDVEAGFTTEPEALACGADCYIVSLKDVALAELLPRLTNGHEEALWIHTAGSVPMDVFRGYANHYGVLYPLQTFSKRREVNFGEIPLFVEGASAEDLHSIQRLAASLSDTVCQTTSQQRQYLHLAAVLACNFTNHLYALAASLLEKHGMDFRVLLPLIDETARKVHELTPLEAQTGPAVRYDVNVMDKHLQLLADEPEVGEIYRRLSESIHKMV